MELRAACSADAAAITQLVRSVIAEREHLAVLPEEHHKNEWDQRRTITERAERGATVTMENVSFTHNTMNNSFIWTGGTNWFPSSGSDKNVVFDYDTYSGMTGPIFKWGTGVYNAISDVRSGLKLEAHGTQK